MNKLGLGPMGIAGKTTTMGVYVERRGTHTSATSTAVAHQCWASRGSEALINENNRVIFHLTFAGLSLEEVIEVAKAFSTYLTPIK